MSAEYERPQFDSKLENTKHFLSPLIKSAQEELAEYQDLQEKYQQVMTGTVLKRVLNKVFGFSLDQTPKIENLELRIKYYQSMIDRFNEDGSEEMQQFLFRTITTYIARIEAAQRDANRKVVYWDDVVGSDSVISPLWILNQGIILLRQLNPDLAAPLDKKLVNLKMNESYVGFDPLPQITDQD